MSTLPSHIPFEQLIDFVEARLTSEERKVVQAHVGGCPFCQSQVVWLEWVIDTMHSDCGEEVPQQLRADAVGLFATRRPVASLRQRPHVRAVLAFDSAQQPFVAGMRAVGSDARQLLFSAGGHELDMRIVPSGGLWAVWGQILGSEESGTVQLQDATQGVQATLNEMNEFSLAPVRAGVYTLTIALNDIDLEIADIQIGL